MRRDQGKAVKFIVLGCLGLIVLCGGLFASCLFVIIKATAAPVKASEEFLQAMSAGGWSDASKRCTTALAPRIEAIGKADPAVWGKSWSVTNRQIETRNGVSAAHITASVSGTDGKSRSVALELVDEGGWRVADLKIDGKSPAGDSGGPAEKEPTAARPRFDAVNVEKKKTGEGFIVVVTCVIRDLRWKAEGDLKRVKTSGEARLLDDKGRDILDEPLRKSVDDAASEAVVTYTYTFTLPPAAAGRKFSVPLKVTDEASGGTAERTEEFELP